MFGNAEVIEADVVFRANWAEFQGDTAKIREAALHTYGALDEGTRRSAIAQEKYDRALARSKGNALAVAKATQTYKAELASIESVQARATSGSTRHSNALKQEERSLAGAARGAIAGSGALGHLGRAAIFASTSLLGGYGLIYAIRSTISAAREQAVSLGHLEVALNNSGLGWQRNKATVESALDTLVKLTAFTNNELTEALATNVRRFGDIDQALNATAIATDVARAKNISLADAVGLVNRASFGQQKAVRSLNVDVTATTTNLDALRASTKNASGEQIAAAKAADQQATRTAYLDAVQKAYLGNAAKYLHGAAGPQAEFNAQLERSREIVGADVLPIFNQYLTELGDWLEKMNSSGKLQKDVNRIVGDAATILHDAGSAAHFLSSNLGGLKGILELLVGLKAASIFRGWLGPLGQAGATAETSSTKVAGLRGSLTRLSALRIAPILITVEVVGLEAVAAKIKALQQGYLTPENQPVDPRVTNSLVPKLAKEYELLQSLAGLTPEQARDTIETRLSAKHVGPRQVTKHDKSDPTGAHDVTITVYDQPTSQAADLVGQAIAYSAGGPEKTRIDKQRNAANGKGRGGTTGGTGGGNGGDGGSTLGGLPYSLQNALLEAQGTPGTGDDVTALNAELAYVQRALAQKGLSGAARNQLLSERNDILGQLQQITDAQATASKQAAATAATKQRKHFTTLSTLPPTLVKRLADARSKDAPEAKVLKILHQEQAALASQERQLEREHAPASYEAKIAKEQQAIHDTINGVIAKARKGRIAKLDAVPAGLKLEEANAIANNASQERLLAIYQKEKKALDAQLATLKSIGATQAEKLKNREAAAAVQKKINAATKQTAGDVAATEREAIATLQEIIGNESNYRLPASGGRGPSVTVNQHFPHPPTDDGLREAQRAHFAAQAAFA